MAQRMQGIKTRIKNAPGAQRLNPHRSDSSTDQEPKETGQAAKASAAERELKMWVYIHQGSGLYTVGHYDPEGKFVPESDKNSRQEAAAHVNYLNGGRGVLEVDQRGEANALAEWFVGQEKGRRH